MTGVVQLKDYLIRVFFASLAVGITFMIANILGINVDVGSYPFLICIAILGGWGGWHLYKKSMKNKSKGIPK
ncbi:hypothetical protein COM49_16890 [Bacillus pseudomycoides]|nr:hypothetical protein COO06_15340 [Bacillus pseudomycoides]PGD99178.1 hypothetical protein COM50_09800 [Bacillus pseudomycoides]PGE01713.1 hypothetical protein COM49_16890 [Bacillus pseudomycoides]PHE68715.1 hypothetical protein COF69_11100 [Bacillus pseudomycoides]PHG23053.1 hypothetical protein COI47_11505 [Bacillus pseudomycoides]